MYAPKHVLWLGLLLWSSVNAYAKEIHNSDTQINEATSTLETARRATDIITTTVRRKIIAVVLEDKNNDGIGDVPIAGVLVELVPRDGGAVRSAYTNFNGKVSFSEIGRAHV